MDPKMTSAETTVSKETSNRYDTIPGALSEDIAKKWDARKICMDVIQADAAKALNSIAEGLGGFIDGTSSMTGEAAANFEKTLNQSTKDRLATVFGEGQAPNGLTGIVERLQNMEVSKIPFVDGGLKKFKDAILNSPHKEKVLQLERELDELHSILNAQIDAKNKERETRLDQALQ
jgi:hypothetical protein